MLALGGALACANLASVASPGRWVGAAFGPEPTAMTEIVFHHSLLPRIAVALLCGAGLGLAGALMQQALRNPLAEPGTLGVFAGARFALAAATLWAPGLLVFGYEPLALAGGATAAALVLLLARRQRFAPLAVVLAGIVVSLALEAANRMLAIGNFEALSDLFVWQAGSLSQNNWDAARRLAPRAALGALAALLLARALAVLELGDAVARGLGASLALVRVAAIAVAVALAASVAGAVGAIGFVGLAAPTIARASGVRTAAGRLLWSALIGSGLLLAADQGLLATAGGMVPTGEATALLGAPLLLWLVARMRAAAGPAEMESAKATKMPDRARVRLVLVAAATPVVVWAALALGRTPDGFVWATGGLFDALWPWRAPRVAASLAAGALLGAAGVVLQRLTGNAMASPELLGVSAGAALMLILAVFLLPPLSPSAALGLATLGAAAALFATLAVGWRSGHAPLQTLMIGAALSALLSSSATLVLASGDPRGAALVAWLAGSTYAVTPAQSAATVVAAVALALALPLTARWLAILPMGGAAAQALGVQAARARLGLLGVAAAATAAATLLVGPLSFVGLVAPHLARFAGARRPLAETMAASAIGGLLLLVADWLGRVVVFPWQIPAGLIATAIGGIYFTWLQQARR